MTPHESRRTLGIELTFDLFSSFTASASLSRSEYVQAFPLSSLTFADLDHLSSRSNGTRSSFELSISSPSSSLPLFLLPSPSELPSPSTDSGSLGSSVSLPTESTSVSSCSRLETQVRRDQTDDSLSLSISQVERSTSSASIRLELSPKKVSRFSEFDPSTRLPDDSQSFTRTSPRFLSPEERTGRRLSSTLSLPVIRSKGSTKTQSSEIPSTSRCSTSPVGSSRKDELGQRRRKNPPPLLLPSLLESRPSSKLLPSRSSDLRLSFKPSFDLPPALHSKSKTPSKPDPE